MGCKEPEACIANKKQNFVGRWKSWQCRPWNWTKVYITSMLLTDVADDSSW